MTHICVGKLTIIGSDNGLSPGRGQAIIWPNPGILLTAPLGTNFNETSIEIHTFSFKEIRLKLSSGKWRLFCLSLCVKAWWYSLAKWLIGATLSCFVGRRTLRADMRGVVGHDTNNGCRKSDHMHNTSLPSMRVDYKWLDRYLSTYHIIPHTRQGQFLAVFNQVSHPRAHVLL